ncbi:uncharacterized protein J3R85_003126 [Psidium guajava]|nr:uncharacterized protein J3R85_003126 [Psidium guajava]
MYGSRGDLLRLTLLFCGAQGPSSNSPFKNVIQIGTVDLDSQLRFLLTGAEKLRVYFMMCLKTWSLKVSSFRMFFSQYLDVKIQLRGIFFAAVVTSKKKQQEIPFVDSLHWPIMRKVRI